MNKPVSESMIRRLTANQRDMLLSHIDCDVGCAMVDGLVMVRKALMGAGLIRGTPQGSSRPRYTALTERGRMAVGMILGHYADALVRSGILEQGNPIDALRRLQAFSLKSPENTPYSPEVSFPEALSKNISD